METGRSREEKHRERTSGHISKTQGEVTREVPSKQKHWAKTEIGGIFT